MTTLTWSKKWIHFLRSERWPPVRTSLTGTPSKGQFSSLIPVVAFRMWRISYQKKTEPIWIIGHVQKMKNKRQLSLLCFSARLTFRRFAQAVRRLPATTIGDFLKMQSFRESFDLQVRKWADIRQKNVSFDENLIIFTLNYKNSPK